MAELEQLAVFRLDEQRYAVPLSVVERVVRAAELTSLPKAPAVVLGVVDVGGRVLPVLNVRRKFNLPERELRVTDQFLIARAGRRSVVLVIDEAQRVLEVPSSEIIVVTEIIPGLEQIKGVAKLRDGLVLIHDLEKFLSLEEERDLDQAINEESSLGT